MAAARAREEELASQAAAGDVKAKAELKRLQMQDKGEETKDEMAALHAKMAAKRALRDPSAEKQKQFEEEERRVAEQKREEERQEKAKREASRRKLKEKAALWN